MVGNRSLSVNAWVQNGAIENSKFKKKTFLDKNGSEIEITRRVYEHFVLYSNTRAWSNMFIWQWEAERLSLFLKKNYPSRKVALLGRVSN